MGFDLIIAGGNDNRPLSEELAGCLVEVRVEQTLDQPTRFAARFLEDIQNGEPQRADQEEFKLDRIITIAVRDGGRLVCLCRGPVLEHRSELTQGGPGSWFEIRGADRRELLNREYREGNWDAKASEVVKVLLAKKNFGIDNVKPSRAPQRKCKDLLPQRGMDLDFIRSHALQNGYHFWISYSDEIETTASGLKVTEHAHWGPSPQPAGSPPGGPPRLEVDKKNPVLKLNVPPDQCPNLTKFQLDIDGARPSAFRSTAQSAEDGRVDPVTAKDPSARLGGKGQGVETIGGLQFLLPQPQGDGATARAVARAALAEAGFFVKAQVSTTRHLLRGVLSPHQVVAVHGLGGPNGETPFRVSEVTHVITGAEHYMDAKLETNVRVQRQRWVYGSG